MYHWLRFVRTGLCLIAAVTVSCAAAGTARAQGKLEAHYVATIAGFSVGAGDWLIDIGPDQYRATVTGGTAGILKAFSGGHGAGAALGQIVDGKLTPAAYTSFTTSGRKNETIKMVLEGGVVKDASIEPEVVNDDPARLPVTEAHRHGVQDPMTAALRQVPGTGSLFGEEACRTAAVFDGRMRYDLRLDYKRIEQVKAGKGYQGPVVVCGISLVPIAGYVPDRPAIKYLVARDDMEVWLAPIAGTRIMVPFRMAIPTPLGPGILEATEFVTSVAAPLSASRMTAQ